MFKKFLDIFSNDLAIDLGTANTLVYMRNHGIIVNEPSVVAVTYNTFDSQSKVRAVGLEAKKMIGKTPEGIKTIKPMQDGVIADFNVTQEMLRYFIRKSISGTKIIKPRIIICIPFGITEVEKRAVKESAVQAGAREVFLIEEPMAAAIGANLPITDPSGNMIVDIGGGTTEVAVISLGGIVFSKSVRVAGEKFDESIINYIKKRYSLLIGERMAESIKISIGNAYPLDIDNDTFEVKGRDLIAGAPKTIEVNSDEIREALSDPIAHVIEAIKVTLEKTPPELASDIVDKGIILTGGGSMLANLDVLIRDKTGLPVALADDPLTCVVRGCGKVIESETLLRQVTMNF
jgi:rod shape-determining protein MreB and related proteins